jgi:NitT/TauT family transport system substrate-binding protein
MSMLRRAMLCAVLLTLAAPAPRVEAAEKMVLAHTAGMDLLGAFVAKDQGFFERRGIDVVFQPAAAGGTMITAVASNSVQASNATVAAMLMAVAQGIELRAIGPIGAVAPGFHLAAMVTSPELALSGAKDLEGRVVAVPGLRAFLHILAIKWLSDNGADPGTVHFVELTFPQMTDALRAKRIDAATLIDPFLTRALAANNARLLANFTDDLPTGTVPTMWVASKSYTDAHPETVRGFQAALGEGIAYARAHPEIADEVLSRYLRLPIEAVRQAPKQPLLDAIAPAQIAFWVDLMRQQKLIAEDIDAASLIFR